MKGNQAWRALDDAAPRTKQRSRVALQLEEELRRLLARYRDPMVEGVWIDLRGRESVWISADGSDGAKP